MIEIYADSSICRVFIRVRIPVGPNMANTKAYWLGWDPPKEIWRAMEEAVPSLICTGINLVTADGEIIMQVPDFANRTLIEELEHLKAAGWVGPCAERELCGMKIETQGTAYEIYQTARALAAITEAKRVGDKLMESALWKRELQNPKAEDWRDALIKELQKSKEPHA